jgi:hypothetical protein
VVSLPPAAAAIVNLTISSYLSNLSNSSDIFISSSGGSLPLQQQQIK